MCLIIFSWQNHSEYPLLMLANRDEFYARPTQAADFWADNPQILAGKDLQSGGTWMGVNRNGRFAAITNYRNGLEEPLKNAPSRGDLVAEFLNGRQSPKYGTRCTTLLLKNPQHQIEFIERRYGEGSVSGEDSWVL